MPTMKALMRKIFIFAIVQIWRFGSVDAFQSLHGHSSHPPSVVTQPASGRPSFPDNICPNNGARSCYNRNLSVLFLQTSSKEDPQTSTDEDSMSTSAGPLALLLFSQFLLFIGVGAVIPSIPLYGKELGFSNAANGIVISIPSVALVLLAKAGGEFADRARKPAMIGGMALIAVSDLGTALANGLPMLLLARLGLGAGRCISESGERGLLADLANKVPSMRGRALAAQQACVALGIAVGAPAGGWVVETYGPRAAFLCVTAAAIVAMTLYCFLPETVATTQTMESMGKVKRTESDLLEVEKAEWKDLLQQDHWRGLVLCQSGTRFGFAAKIASVPLLAASTLPGGAAGAGALVSAAGVSGLVGAPLGGFLTDRAGAKVAATASGILSSISLLLVPLTLSETIADSTFQLPLANDVVLNANAAAFAGAIILWSIGAAAQTPALVALAQKQAPLGQEATALSLPKAFADGTYIVVPFILGSVADHFSSTRGVECAVAGAASLLGVVALVALCSDDTAQ